MTIEIRPAAVIAQIEAKGGMLESLRAEAAEKRAAALSFSQDASLQGAGWDAARERMAAHACLLSAVGLAAEAAKLCDEKVSSALAGYFGGGGRVSEREWLDKKREAEQRQADLESALDRMRRMPGGAGAWGEWIYGSLIRSAAASASAAGDMLSKIYSYCAETNGAYDGPSGLGEHIGKGCAALAVSGYSPATGTWGKLDTSWQAELGTEAAKAACAAYLEKSRRDPSSVFLSPDGATLFAGGRAIGLEGADSDEVVSILVGAGVDAAFDLEALRVDLAAKAAASDVLAAVGITAPGGYRFTDDGKVVFSGYAMAEGAGKMTTRANRENIGKYARPSAVFEAEGVEAKGRAHAAGLKVGSGVLTGLFASLDAAGSYNKSYDAGAGKPEDRRRSDAEAAVVGSLVESGAGVVGGAVGAAALVGIVGWATSGPVGGSVGVIGGAIGGIAATIGANKALESDFDGDNRSTQADIDEWWYSEGGHDVVDKAFNEYPEAYWEQLTTAPTGMARL